MVEHYKKTVIQIIVGPVGKSRWKPTCEIAFKKNAREVLKNLEIPLDYDTPEQAERAGMVFSKKWVDAGKPVPLTL